MARRTYVQNYDIDGNPTYKPDGSAEFVLKHERIYGPYMEGQKRDTAMVMRDIDPYQSTIDGSIITSRSKHRAHLKEHGCVEMGCDSVEATKKYFPPPNDKADIRKDVLRAYEMTPDA